VHLYYPAGQHNAYIDASNTMQLFRALVFNADPAAITWAPGGSAGPEFLYQVAGSGAPVNLQITASLPDGTSDSSSVSVLNYHWPGIV
jgi:hypothetical protein